MDRGERTIMDVSERKGDWDPRLRARSSGPEFRIFEMSRDAAAKFEI